MFFSAFSIVFFLSFLKKTVWKRVLKCSFCRPRNTRNFLRQEIPTVATVNLLQWNRLVGGFQNVELKWFHTCFVGHFCPPNPWKDDEQLDVHIFFRWVWLVETTRVCWFTTSCSLPGFAAATLYPWRCQLQQFELNEVGNLERMDGDRHSHVLVYHR